MQKIQHLAGSLLGFELVGAARLEDALPHKKKAGALPLRHAPTKNKSIENISKNFYVVLNISVS